MGVTEVTAGGGGGGAWFTVKLLLRLLDWLSGLVTVTVLVPTVALNATELFAVSWDVELNAHEFTIIPAPKLHVAPL